MQSSPTFVPPPLSRSVVELQVDVAVLSGFGSVLAVFCSFVGLVVDLGTECMSELFCGAAALLTQIVTVSEVLAQVRVVAVDVDKDVNKCLKTTATTRQSTPGVPPAATHL